MYVDRPKGIFTPQMRPLYVLHYQICEEKLNVTQAGTFWLTQYVVKMGEMSFPLPRLSFPHS